MRDRERQAANVPTHAAPGVADEGLALRTVMRDAGKAPLEPPGRPRDQQWPRMAAAGARVRSAPPSAVLTRRSRLRAVWPLGQRACAPGVLRCRGLHHRAPLCDATTRGAHAPAPRLTGVTDRHHRGPHTERLDGGPSVQKSTVALTPQRLASFQPPLWPGTQKARERLSGRLQTSRRHLTGRKHTPAWILRAGRFGAILGGLPHTPHGVEAFPHVHLTAFRHPLTRLRQTEQRRTCGHARRHRGAALSAWEPQGLPHE